MLKLNRIAVGISGGVDSAVAALLLKRKGYDVQGVFMQNWDIADETGQCSSDEDYKDASDLCDRLKIKLHRANFVKQYWNEVFCELIKEYESGFTPNPDILCNRNIKFDYFYKFARENLNSDAIATGHYARTSFGAYLEHYKTDENVRLLMAKDTKKDQTFFLSQIKQNALRRTMFPLGDLMKTRVKQIAVDNGLEKFAQKKESMGICFIGTRNFQNFIREYVDDKPGVFINVDDGKIVGQHLGVHQWTLGQRTKLGGFSDAFFTARKDIKNNIIYVAQGTKHPILYTNLVFTSEPYWIHSKPRDLENGDVLKCQFIFQHTQRWINCLVFETSRGLIIKLEKNKRAITPGQYAVLAKDNEILGSAKISNAGCSNFSLHYLEDYKIGNVPPDILMKYRKLNFNAENPFENVAMMLNK